MKLRSLGLLFAIPALCVPALANTYHGDLTLTFTSVFTNGQPGIDGVSVGDVYTGWYEYDSDTLDTAGSSWQVSQGNFHGGINVPPILTPNHSGFIEMYFNDWIVVTGGQVTVFGWGFDAGPLSGNLFLGNPFLLNGAAGFNMGTQNLQNGDRLGVAGTMVVGNPVIKTVPDTDATAALMGIAFASLAAMRRRIRLSAN